MSKILKLPDVIDRCGLSRSSIYAFIRDQTFPAPIPLGKRSVGWKSDEITTWIEQRAEMRGVK